MLPGALVAVLLGARSTRTLGVSAMPRLAISRETLIALFAKSGNVCAFPGCTHELVTSRNLFVGQICHIEAAQPGGPRFNPASTDEERRSFGNLLLLCYRHHRETDDVVTFDSKTLVAMKHQHESQHAEKPFKINEAFLHRLELEMQAYWQSIETANTSLHVAPEFAVRLHVATAATALFVEIDKSVERLSAILVDLADRDMTLNAEIQAHLKALGYDTAPYDAVPYFKNPFRNRNWETHALAVNNTLTDLVVALKQAEVCFLSEYVKTHSNDSSGIASLEAAKAELHEMALSAGYAD